LDADGVLSASAGIGGSDDSVNMTPGYDTLFDQLHTVAAPLLLLAGLALLAARAPARSLATLLPGA
jgi:hypothetical protein